jgi:hypothetical protein
VGVTLPQAIMPSSRSKKHKLDLRPQKFQAIRLPLRPSPASTQAEEQRPVNEQIQEFRRQQAVLTRPTIESRQKRALMASRRRVTAGPPPPRSWIEGNFAGNESFKYGLGATSSTVRERRPQKLDYFPGLKNLTTASRRTLQHLSMKALASDIEWQVEYNHAYLSILPLEVKQQLLSYVASYGPSNGLSVKDLNMVFRTQEEVDEHEEHIEPTDCADVTRLDLGGSIGRGMTLKQLTKFWQLKTRKKVIGRGKDTSSSPVDSWDMEECIQRGVPTSLTSPLRFPALTHLSLAYPGQSSWSELLRFSRHLGALTHLSLASWPAPSFDSVFEVDGLSAERTSDADQNLAEGAHLLRLFSRATPSLQYLCLDGCGDWFNVLWYTNPPCTRARTRTTLPPASDFGPGSSSMISPEWTESWRNITTLSLSQGVVPLGLPLFSVNQLYIERGRVRCELESLVREAYAQHDLSGPLASMSLFPRVPRTMPEEPSYLPNPGENHLQARHFPVPASRLPGLEASMHAHGTTSHGESYTINAPSTIAQNIQAQVRRKEWYKHEIEALKVEGWIRSSRERSRGAKCHVEHGWDKTDLIEAGYDEQKLFEAGF